MIFLFVITFEKKWRKQSFGGKNILQCCRESGKRLSFQGTVACSAMVSRGFESETRLGAIFFHMQARKKLFSDFY